MLSQQELEQRLLELEELNRLKEKEDWLKKNLPHIHGWDWYQWAWDFYVSRNRECFICAANQISKSSTQIRKFIELSTNKNLWKEFWPALQDGQAPNQMWYFYPTMDVATVEFETKWSLFLPGPDLKDDPVYGWKEEYVKKQIKKVIFNSGVTIYFKSYKQDEQDLQSGTVYYIGCDEEPPVELLGELGARLNASDGYFSAVFTATRGQEYWRRTMEPRNKEDELHPNAFKQTVSVFDCQFYMNGKPSHWNKEKIQRAIAKCGTKAEEDKRIWGKFVLAGGRKFEAYDPIKNRSEKHMLPSGWLIYAGVDPGGGGESHPSAIVFLAVDPEFKKGRVFKAWRGDKILTTAGDLVLKYRELRGNLKPVAEKYDFQAKDFGTISDRMGENFTKANKSHEEGVSLLNTLFKHQKIKIMRDDPELDKLSDELSSVLSSTDKAKAKDDLCDALRFAAIEVPWDYSDVETGDFNDPSLKEPDQPKEKTEAEKRRDYYMGVGARSADHVQEELDEWNEAYES